MVKLEVLKLCRQTVLVSDFTEALFSLINYMDYLSTGQTFYQKRRYLYEKDISSIYIHLNLLIT